MTSVCAQNFNMMQSQQKYIMVPVLYQQHKTIAPAPDNRKTPSILGMNGVNMMQSSGGHIGKKKYTYHNMPYGEQLPSVARRNARERNRVKQVNNGFANLRQHIPQSVISALSSGGRGASKKLSKVDTLRIAVEYIRGLQDMLDDGDSSQGSASPSLSASSSVFYPTENSTDEFPLQHSYNSEASASPSPSCSSEISIGGSGSGSGYLHSSGSDDHIQFKFEPFESYDAPDDDEILDYISTWQEH